MNRFPENLLNALRAEECILFIGSGISQWSGLPSWEELLRHMLAYLDERALLQGTEKAEIEALVQRGDLLTAASICSSYVRKADLRDFVDAVFIDPNPRPHEIHTIIVELGPDSFITTNYDRLIEEAFQSAHGVALTVVNNDQTIEQAKIMKHGAARFIFTPHGRADNVNTIILSHEDYRRIQYGSESVIRTMEHLFLSRPVIYLGFGLRDPDFLMIKDQIAATYQGAEREHYAIMPDVSDLMKRHWRENYGINIVSYPARQADSENEQGRDRKCSHDELLVLLRMLQDELKAPTHAVTTVAVEPTRFLYASLIRSAMIRFCEDIVHSFADLQGQGVRLFASFRADLCADKIERGKIHRRRLALLELLDSISSLVIIGAPGSGKTYAMQSYAGILARRALETLRSIEAPDDAAIKHTIPLILPMREYRGNIEEMIIERLPRSMDARLALQSGLFVIIFDAINEVSRALVQDKLPLRDIVSFLAKYPSNRYIFTSRAIHYVPPVGLPVFELQPIGRADLSNYLKSKGISFEALSPTMKKTLRNPLLLSMFVELSGQIGEVANTTTLLGSYFDAIERQFERMAGKGVPLGTILAPVAYELIRDGSQTLTSSEIEREFQRVLAKIAHDQAPSPQEILKSLISLGVLVPDADGKVGFFHQTALEYAAAVELLSRHVKGSLSVKDLLEFRRWDETIVLFLALLPPNQRKKVLGEISKIDIIFACHAFESATIKDESIGLLLFDIVDKELCDTHLPEIKREILAEAAISLAPLGRKRVLGKWLDDKTAQVTRSAAVFLGLMGAKEYVPKLISKLLKDNLWPSPFAEALYMIADESIVNKLIARGKSTRSELATDNLADVLKRFESDSLYQELRKLSQSSIEKQRRFSARILSNLESQRSKDLLTELLWDSSGQVRWQPIFGLNQSNYKTDKIIARMFELLADRESGCWAADYLFDQSDASIINEAKRRIDSPRNALDLINLCAVLSKSDPNRARDLLFEKLRNYKPSFDESLYLALSKLPIDRILPDILGFLHIENAKLHETVIETLTWVHHMEQLPISEDDCEYLVSLWERLPAHDITRSNLSLLLSSAFQAVAKPLLLKRFADPAYRLRGQLIPIISRMPLTQGDLSPDLVEWVMGKFDMNMYPDFWPAGEIIGKVIEESMVTEKLIPLLSSSNSAVRNNAYRAIRTAEHRLGKRILRK